MELLAPAGTYDCVLTAVNCGADAVYFAGREFGARSFAGNLSTEEIYKATDFCHLHGAKAYVTVNTLVYDREYKELEKFIKILTRAGVDAVIVQDLGVLSLVREISPDLELHASTQMTIHSADGVGELERLGVSRVVLSRELSREEIKSIKNKTSAELEVFVHGAMCMSYSGQCLMSSVIGGRSGNRGKCAQPCRLPYFCDDKESFYLSLKDMCLAEHIEELDKIGVSSLKIEGRMKGESYVSAVVSSYRRLIDERRAPSRAEMEHLSSIFYRGGFTDGYYIDKKGPDMFAFDKPDNPYLRNSSSSAKEEAKQIPIRLEAKFCQGEIPHIIMRYGETVAEAFGTESVQRAIGKPLQLTDLTARLCKTGGTPFKVEDAKVELSDMAFVPVGEINSLRRECAGRLEEEILKPYREKRTKEHREEARFKRKGDGKYTCSVLNIEQYRAVRELEFEFIYVPLDIVEEYSKELLQERERIVICPPVIIKEPLRNKYKDRLAKLKDKGFLRAMVSTIDAIDLCDGFILHGDYRMNITNSYSARECRGLGLFSVCLSAELNLAQIRDIQKPEMTEIIGYGRLPLMITENCILKNMGKCSCGKMGKMVDRTGATFPIIRDVDICTSVVLNSVPLYVGDKADELKNLGTDYIRLMFTTESQSECKTIYNAYKNNEKCPLDAFTRLHFLRGALA